MTSSSGAIAPSIGGPGRRPIVFQAGGFYETCLGWTLLLDEPGLKVVARRIGPVKRCLIMAQGVASAQIDLAVRRLRLLDPRTDCVLHDFDNSELEERVVAGRPWRRLLDDERMLNKATFIVDLMRDDDAMLQAMHRTTRLNVRKAQGRACASNDWIALRTTYFGTTFRASRRWPGNAG